MFSPQGHFPIPWAVHQVHTPLLPIPQPAMGESVFFTVVLLVFSLVVISIVHSCTYFQSLSCNLAFVLQVFSCLLPCPVQTLPLPPLLNHGNKQPHRVQHHGNKQSHKVQHHGNKQLRKVQHHGNKRPHKVQHHGNRPLPECSSLPWWLLLPLPSQLEPLPLHPLNRHGWVTLNVYMYCNYVWLLVLSVSSVVVPTVPLWLVLSGVW